MAYIAEPRVRETSTTTGTADLTLAGAMRGSLAFAEVMVAGDTCDYVVHYDTCFEEGLGTLGAGGELQRTTIYRARQPDGTVNTTKVSLPAGVKTVIMTVRAKKVAVVHVAQSFSQTERDRMCENLGLPKSGNKVIIPEATAWVGWTKDTSQHDAAIRLVTDGNGGGTGGSVAFSTLHARTATDSVTLSTNEMPSHSHGGATANGGVDHTHSEDGTTPSGTASGPGGLSHPVPSGKTTGGASAYIHAHSISAQGGGASFAPTIDMRVKYRNCILCTKD